jgi:sugar phosphate isomerase/epimerase
MYVSIRDGIVLHAKYDSLLEGLRRLGVQAVELQYGRDRGVRSLTGDGAQPSVVLDSPDAVERYRDHLAQHGVRGSAFMLATDFNSADFDGQVEWTVSAVRAAHALGMAAIRIDAIMTGERELPLEERVERCVKAVTTILERTADTPVALGIENHGYRGNDPAFLDSVFARIGSDRFGMTLDTGNFYWAGHPLERVYQILEHLAPRCKHTHCKNIKYPPELRNQQRELGWKYGEYAAPLDEGDIDHRRVAAILRKAGYDGDLCIEDESLGRYSEADQREVLRRDVEHLRQILKA